jgi:hypothetical protein
MKNKRAPALNPARTDKSTKMAAFITRFSMLLRCLLYYSFGIFKRKALS